MTIVLDGSAGITNDGGYTGDGVVFADTTPANTLVTTTGGNVGVGTSSPNKTGIGRALTVNGSANSGVELAAGDVCYGLVFANSSRFSLDTNNSGANIINFYTSNAERARIDSSGNLLVGTTSNNGLGISLQPGGGDPSAVFNGNSASNTVISFRYNSTQVGSITRSTTATAFNTSSDYRLKEDIAPMTGALAKVAALKPCTYKWKADGSDGEGFIAHELQAVVPDCVTGEKDAVDAEGKPVYQGIDTSFLVATLTAAIQEQQAIITALTARVAALEGTQP